MAVVMIVIDAVVVTMVFGMIWDLVDVVAVVVVRIHTYHYSHWMMLLMVNSVVVLIPFPQYSYWEVEEYQLHVEYHPN